MSCLQELKRGFIISNKEFACYFTVNVITYLEAIAFTSDLLT